MQLRILADDITGAADSAARVHTRGMPVRIALRGVSLASCAVALTSDSRHLAPEAAAASVRGAVAAAHTARATLWYKKIDSTLRGNVAAELDAMLDATGSSVAVVCPAFPAQGRGLLGGRLVAPGVAGPGVDARELLGAGARPMVHVQLDTVRAGIAALADHFAAFGELHQRGLIHEGLLILVDALQDDDLATIEAATARALPHALRCGSAGLVGWLARRLVAEEADHIVSPAPPRIEPPRGPRLFVIGSGSIVARRQIDRLRASGARVIEHRADTPLTEHTAPHTEATNEALVVLHLPAAREGEALDGPWARSYAEQLAARAAQLIDTFDPALLVLSGGDTAMAVLTRLGVQELAVLHEVQPGVPLTHGVDAAGRARRFVLKPGSFGGDDALLKLAHLPDARGRDDSR